ncbi:MAG: hypothetical protein IJR55_06970 [Clostridia bacterium]|nr:hypothetical protein [Clostridia bacterium]
MTPCKNCRKPLSRDEIALYKRLIYRGAEDDECICIKCLADKLNVSEAALFDKIDHFKKAGCTLFE